MKNLMLLGATGSIGSQVLEILRESKEYNLKSIAVGKNIKKEFNPEFVSLQTKEDMEKLQAMYPNIQFGYGDTGLIQVATYLKEKGYLINSIVGMVGLKPTVAAIKAGHDVLLANKETLVVAGNIIMDLVKKHNVRLIPIDKIGR